MSSPPLHILTPEEEELQRKLEALESVEQTLADREMDLRALEVRVLGFERIYMEQVGTLYARLDEAMAEAARWRALAAPDDAAAQQEAETARQQAEISIRAIKDAEEDTSPHGSLPTEEIKKLYREIAKLIHPDLTLEDAERARRTELMAEANLAFRDGHVDKLQRILHEWKSSPETVRGKDAVSELVRTIRKVAQAERRLRAIEEDLAWLQESELHRLQQLVERAEGEGRDLLMEMATHLTGQITEAETVLATLHKKKTTRIAA